MATSAAGAGVAVFRYQTRRKAANRQAKPMLEMRPRISKPE